MSRALRLWKKDFPPALLNPNTRLNPTETDSDNKQNNNEEAPQSRFNQFSRRDLLFKFICFLDAIKYSGDLSLLLIIFCDEFIPIKNL